MNINTIRLTETHILNSFIYCIKLRQLIHNLNRLVDMVVINPPEWGYGSPKN